MSRFEEDACNECDICGNLWMTCTCTEEQLKEIFDENIPDEVLNDPSWEPKLLPEPNNLLNNDYDLDDIQEYDE